MPWGGEILRLSDDVRKCVVFLGSQEPGPIDAAPIRPSGPGFFVVGEKGLRLYLVTAKHVADELTPPFVIRINKKGNGAGLIHIEQPSDIDWISHNDPSVDLAVAPIFLPAWVDTYGMNADNMYRELADVAKLETGDSACVVGLFHLLSGKRRNIPITLVGHIAMLPGDELIPVGNSFQEGYLVQANAISGCSGAPVFAARSVSFHMGGSGIIGTHTKAPLLGVWTASWKVRGSEIVAVGVPDGRGELAPLGMGVVTPLQKLVDIIRSDRLKSASDRLLQKVIRMRAATPDVASADL